jgi:hypothetical protein
MDKVHKHNSINETTWLSMTGFFFINLIHKLCTLFFFQPSFWAVSINHFCRQANLSPHSSVSSLPLEYLIVITFSTINEHKKF